ncbi:MAG: metal ABC transporter ATP-binding protein [Fibrobacteres bacterium]|nr:metal ABC transporter ATP-binding protein [Fibrobacterota bacterium]
MIKEAADVCGACCTRLEKVSVSFGHTKVLHEINLHIHCGQLAVIIGPNGAGKTTLFRAMLGEIPYSGKIHNDQSVAKNGQVFKTGYVPQHLDFDPTSPVSVLDLFSASLTRFPVWAGNRKRIVKLAEESLIKVNAENCITERLGTLSGGQLQRVMLALALTPVPDILLLDEPVSGIDPAGVDLFYRMVSELRHKYHLAVLLVSHDCAIAARHADRMIFLNKSVLADGLPHDVLKSDIVTRTFGSIALPEIAPHDHSHQFCCITGKEV